MSDSFKSLLGSVWEKQLKRGKGLLCLEVLLQYFWGFWQGRSMLFVMTTSKWWQGKGKCSNVTFKMCCLKRFCHLSKLPQAFETSALSEHFRPSQQYVKQNCWTSKPCSVSSHGPTFNSYCCGPITWGSKLRGTYCPHTGVITLNSVMSVWRSLFCFLFNISLVIQNQENLSCTICLMSHSENLTHNII